MPECHQLTRDTWLDPENKTVTSCNASISGVYKGWIVDQGQKTSTRKTGR